MNNYNKLGYSKLFYLKKNKLRGCNMQYLLTLLLLVSCGNNIAVKKVAEVSISKGEVIYKTRCISCHNADPTKAGKIGPDIDNSSFELIKEKTQNRSYPKDYTPKRKTKIMPRIPLTDEQIKSLEIFLRKR